MDDGRYAVVTADERDGHEGQYRLGFSETAEFDGDRMKIMEGVSLESLKKDLTGIANGSIVVGENPWYTPENEILSGNAIDELLSASPQSVSNVFGGYNADIRDKKKPVNKRRAFLYQVCSVIYSSTSALA